MWKHVSALLVVLLATAAGAAPFGLSDEEAEALLDQLAGRYEVIATSHGYVLRPREEAELAPRLVEVEERAVLVDGELLDAEALAERLGPDEAGLLYALAGDRDATVQLEEAAAAREEELLRQLEEAEEERERERGREDERRERRDRGSVDTGSRVSVGSGLTLAEDEIASNVVVIFGDLDVRGKVEGDAVVVGSVEVDGEVGGNLTVVGGSISVGENADVYGDVNAIGTRVHDPHGRIHGRLTEISGGELFRGWGDSDWHWVWWDPPWLDLVNLVMNTVVLTILLLLVVAAARRKVGTVAARVRHEPWKSGLIGFLVEILTVPILLLVSILLIVSVVGIPLFLLLVPLAILAFAVLLCLGFAGVAQALGEIFTRRAGDLRRLSPFVAVVVGIGLIQVWQIFGETLTLAGGIVGLAAYLLVVTGFFFKYVAWTVGLGAVVLERFAPPQPATPATPLPQLPDLEPPTSQESA